MNYVPPAGALKGKRHKGPRLSNRRTLQHNRIASGLRMGKSFVNNLHMVRTRVDFEDKCVGSSAVTSSAKAPRASQGGAKPTRKPKTKSAAESTSPPSPPSAPAASVQVVASPPSAPAASVQVVASPPSAPAASSRLVTPPSFPLSASDVVAVKRFVSGPHAPRSAPAYTYMSDGCPELDVVAVKRVVSGPHAPPSTAVFTAYTEDESSWLKGYAGLGASMPYVSDGSPELEGGSGSLGTCSVKQARLGMTGPKPRTGGVLGTSFLSREEREDLAEKTVSPRLSVLNNTGPGASMHMSEGGPQLDSVTPDKKKGKKSYEGLESSSGWCAAASNSSGGGKRARQQTQLMSF